MAVVSSGIEKTAIESTHTHRQKQKPKKKKKIKQQQQKTPQKQELAEQCFKISTFQKFAALMAPCCMTFSDLLILCQPESDFSCQQAH